MRIPNQIIFGLLCFFASDCSSLTGNGQSKINVSISGVPLTVEVASEPETRNRGLMYRTSLPENHGMLFVWSGSEYRNFWMKNTYIPLDIAFFDPQLYLINIETMKPDDGSGNYGEYKSTEPAMYAIEVNAGWYNKHNIKKFDQLKLPRPVSASR